MNFPLQPTLEDEIVRLQPLQEGEFEALFKVASDPLIWEQHPSKTRYQKSVFENFFKGAIESKGAFAIFDKVSGDMIGSTRFYDYNPEMKEILIGYTFISRAYWGKRFNFAIKRLMLDYAFKYVDTVLFHIGTNNIRSRTAMERLGGILRGKVDTAYYGESSNENCIYEISKSAWLEK